MTGSDDPWLKAAFAVLLAACICMVFVMAGMAVGVWRSALGSR